MNLPYLFGPRYVLMTADTLGGVWTYAMELVRALAEHDVRIGLAPMGAPLSPAQRAEVARLENVEVFEGRFKLEWMANPWPDLERAGEWLLALEQQVHPDVVHLNGYTHAALPWKTPKLVVGHSCVLSWWEAVKREPVPADWSRYQQAVTKGLRAADLVVAPSRAMLNALNHHYGPLSSGEVIPNGRHPQRFFQRQKEHLILSAGRLWDEAKNIIALAKVAPNLPWPIFVAGEERHPDTGKHLQIGQLCLLGRLSPESIAEWYARASIYVLPARYEPFGFSALEAALSGCALVLGDIASLREIWGDAALFVPPDDTAALEEALRHLIQDSQARALLAHRCHERALEFTPERMASAYFSAYSDLMMVKVPVALGESESAV